jgi:RecB family endonuclease NucS
MELSLDEAVAMGNGKSPRRRRARKAAAIKKPAAKAPAAPAPKPQNKPQKKTARPAASSATPMTLDAEHIRHLVCERPELLETGLLALADGKGGIIGVGYETDIGEIDLLARDESGAYVVVMVSGSDTGPHVVSEILHRVGWVRKHLCEGESKVRGILLIEGMDEELGYAATAVADTIDFRTWRLDVSFQVLEV